MQHAELKKIYPINKKTKAFIFKVSVDNYENIFNKWDDSIQERRDLSPGLKVYLEDCSKDIPIKEKIEIDLNICEKRDKEKEKITKQGLKNYFQSYQFFIRKEYNLAKSKALKSLIYGIVFIIISTITENLVNSILTKILFEGLVIGGWVFIWTTFETIFFEVTPIIKKLKIYQRLLNSKITFKSHSLK